MYDFWTRFTIENAHDFFDCCYGNQDGQVSFSEYNSGLHNIGFTSSWSCSGEQSSNWINQFNTNAPNVTRDFAMNENWGPVWETWAGFAGDQSVKSVNHEDWVTNSIYNLNLTASDAEMAW